jgi:hypothetical protein
MATVFGRTTQVLDAGFKIILEALDGGRILRPVLPAEFFRVTSCRFLVRGIINGIEIDLHLADDDGRNLAQDIALLMEEANKKSKGGEKKKPTGNGGKK